MPEQIPEWAINKAAEAYYSVFTRERFNAPNDVVRCELIESIARALVEQMERYCRAVCQMCASGWTCMDGTHHATTRGRIKCDAEAIRRAAAEAGEGE